MIQSDTGGSADIYIRITLKLGRLYSDSKSALKMENSRFLREIDGQAPWTRPLAQGFVDYYARHRLFDLANFDGFTSPNRTNDPHRLAVIPLKGYGIWLVVLAPHSWSVGLIPRRHQLLSCTLA